MGESVIGCSRALSANRIASSFATANRESGEFEIEGKTARVAARERGQRESFNLSIRRKPIRSNR
jgi:hypothetical protein